MSLHGTPPPKKPELTDKVLLQLIACKSDLAKKSLACFRFRDFVEPLVPAHMLRAYVDKVEVVEYTIDSAMLIEAIERLMLERDAALEMLSASRIK